MLMMTWSKNLHLPHSCFLTVVESQGEQSQTICGQLYSSHRGYGWYALLCFVHASISQLEVQCWMALSLFFLLEGVSLVVSDNQRLQKGITIILNF